MDCQQEGSAGPCELRDPYAQAPGDVTSIIGDEEHAAS